jgi:hypothetical protein
MSARYGPSAACAHAVALAADVVSPGQAGARVVMRAGVALEPNRTVLRLCAAGAVTGCAFTGEEQATETDAVVLVTARLQDDVPHSELHSNSRHHR